MRPWAAQVALDQQGPGSGLRERDREVDRGRGLALAGQGRGDDEDLLRGIDVDELEIRTQHPEGLDPRGMTVEVRHQWLGLRHRVERDHAQHRRLDGVGDVLRGGDRRVQQLTHDHDAHPEQQTQHAAEGEVAQRLRRDRRPRLGGGIDDAGLDRAARSRLAGSPARARGRRSSRRRTERWSEPAAGPGPRSRCGGRPSPGRPRSSPRPRSSSEVMSRSSSETTVWASSRLLVTRSAYDVTRCAEKRPPW